MKQHSFGKRLAPMLLALVVLAGVFSCPVFAAQQETPTTQSQSGTARSSQQPESTAGEPAPSEEDGEAAPQTVPAQLSGIKGADAAEIALGEIAKSAAREGYQFLYAELGSLQVVTVGWDDEGQTLSCRTLAGDTVRFDPQQDTLLLYYQQKTQPVFHTAQVAASGQAQHPATAAHLAAAHSAHGGMLV